MGNSWSSFDEKSEHVSDTVKKGSDPDKKKKTRRSKTLRNRSAEYSNKTPITDQVRDIRDYNLTHNPSYNDTDDTGYTTRRHDIEPIENYTPSLEYTPNHNNDAPVKKPTGSRIPKHSKRRKTVKFREDLDETDV